MDNELITKKNRWRINWKWFLPLAAVVLVGIGFFLIISKITVAKKERDNGIAFDQAKWKAKDDSGYPYRNKMLTDLVSNDTLKHLKKDQVINLLGPPDRTDNVYLFYTVAQQRLQFFPLHVTTLVIKLSDSTANSVMIHE